MLGSVRLKNRLHQGRFTDYFPLFPHHRRVLFAIYVQPVSQTLKIVSIGQDLRVLSLEAK